jgi:cellulose synthase/poly-beta-1,6-N-acetylglucosamine synthase-like glycosyltransferase
LITAITIAILAITSVALFGFGLNLLYLTWRSTRTKARVPPLVKAGDEPLVCVQVPIYNERYVAERVLDAVCALDWPHDRLEVQVLDDSDDDTVSIISRRAAHWQRKGVDVRHVRRLSRGGFKAGALAYGLARTEAPFVAIFDADFVPPGDFLRRTLGVFEDATVGFAQARWGHLNEGYSWFTRLQALAIDFHFLVEQAVRSSAGYFTNFTGTAGVWRRTAIEDSGGWSAATLTEDLDLSYRAQLRGWRAAYLEELVVPEELPVSVDAYRRQQSRWATGSFQSAFILLGPVLRSRFRATVKLQAAIHLLAYGVGPLMLVQLACYPLLLITYSEMHIRLPWWVTDASVVAILVGIAPWIGFVVAQTRRGRRWWTGIPSVLCQLVGAGMSVNTIFAFAKATRRGGVFERTPKHSIVEAGQEWRDKEYVRVGDPRTAVEAAFGVAAFALVSWALAAGDLLVAAFSFLFGIAFALVSFLSAVEYLEVITLRRLGRRALARLRGVTPPAGILLACALLLQVTALLPEPFEDGYGHWLIAANLASTGNLHDPLFNMEDTWLPGYHVLAAAVLHVFGLWQLGVLKAMGALLGLATLACVYALAPSVRQGRLAAVLLVLNPVFLFTSGSAVVEPLLTSLLMAGALAAVRARMRLAALLALLAALTATKAWIWIGAVGAIFLGERLVGAIRHGARRPLPAAAWGVPAIAVIVLVQVGLGPIGHSIARGSAELVSATARGGIPAGAGARLLELASTYGLAALPLFALGLAGAVAAIRRPAVIGGSGLIRFVYVPSLVYLVVVFALVGAGAYTGSHRYLYPALPGLALMAAAVLDRQAVPVRLLGAATGALLSIAFVPVFASFASGNTGLIAAGKEVIGAPGMLITDSPVAAYYSGKPPSEISGSQALPADHDGAVAWMQAHGVSTLVLEDISYYRATSVFPGLAAGHAEGPFSAVGTDSRYQIAGGKPAHVYTFGSTFLVEPVSGAKDLVLTSTQGPGKTSILTKGLVLRTSDGIAAGEGMGFGVPIVQYPDGWVYSRTAASADLSTASRTVWRRTYSLDEMGGDAEHAYAFVPIASRGTIEVTYTFDQGKIGISVRVIALSPGYTQVGILNEQSAAFDNFADSSQTLRGTGFGSWVSVDGSWARLRSARLELEWSQPAIPGAALHGGRELIGREFDWAGLDYMFGPTFQATDYVISIQQAR